MNWNLSIAYPWWFVGLCLLCGIVYAAILYGRKARREDVQGPIWLQYLLPFFRFCLVSLLAFLLLAPIFNYIDFKKEKPILLVLADNSQSISKSKLGKDAEWVREGVNKIKNDVAENYDVEIAQFASGAQFTEPNAIDLSSTETNMGSALRFAKEQFVNRNLAGVVLMSDGIFTSGSNPEYLLGDSKVPIHTVGLGDTNKVVDFAVADVASNSIAYLGNEYPVKVGVKASKLKGKSGQLTVLVNGSVVGQKQVYVENDDYYYEADFKIKAKKIGQTKLVAKLTVFDNEENKTNNTYTSYIEVIDGKKRVEIWTNGVHPDVGMLKSTILKNDNYSCTIVKRNFAVDNKTDLVVLYNWFANRKQVAVFEKLKSSGIPTLIIVGGDFNGIHFNAATIDASFSAVGKGRNAALPLINDQFEFFELEEGEKSTMAKWPPLSAPFGKFKGIKPTDIVLYQQIGSVKTKEPLLSVGSENNYRYGIVSGSGLWQWKLNDYEKNGNHGASESLVNKVVQYLSVKQEKKLLKVYSSKGNYSVGDEIGLLGELYNQSLEPIANQELRVSLQDAKGKIFKFTMNTNGNGYKLKIPNLEEGTYRFSASASVGGTKLKDNGFFNVTGTQRELINLSADFGMLKAMSKQTGGYFYDADELNNLVAMLNSAEAKSVIKEEETSKSLINLRWLFWVLMSLLAVEWFVRKWTGGY